MRAARPAGETHWQVMTAGIVLVAVVLRAMAFSPLDQHHADELTQYMEQANRIVTGYGIVPWESRLGIRNSLIPQLLSLPTALGRMLAPGTLAPMYAARITYAALTLVILPAAWRLGALTSQGHAFVAMFVAAVWWQSVLFSDLLLSESLATGVILLAAAPLLQPTAGPRTIGASAFLLGLGLLLRFQFAPFAAVLTLHALKSAPSRIKAMAVGGLAAMALGAISDLISGATPFAWVFANLSQNIGAGRAASFGASGPFHYVAEYYRHFGAGALLFAAIAIIPAARRYAPLLLAALVTVAAHSLLAHKEYRFVWIATQAVMIVAGVGSLSLIQSLIGHRRAEWAMGVGAPLATCAIWALLNLASFSATGGYRSMRGGGGLSELAVLAAKDQKVCRLAVAQAYYLYAAPSILPRRVPISVIPEGVLERRAAMPRQIALAANAVLAGDTPPIGLWGYRKIACTNLPDERPCLYVRAGGCTPDPYYDLQASLERAGL